MLEAHQHEAEDKGKEEAPERCRVDKADAQPVLQRSSCSAGSFTIESLEQPQVVLACTLCVGPGWAAEQVLAELLGGGGLATDVPSPAVS